MEKLSEFSLIIDFVSESMQDQKLLANIVCDWILYIVCLDIKVLNEKHNIAVLVLNTSANISTLNTHPWSGRTCSVQHATNLRFLVRVYKKKMHPLLKGSVGLTPRLPHNIVWIIIAFQWDRISDNSVPDAQFFLILLFTFSRDYELNHFVKGGVVVITLLPLRYFL